MSSPSENDQFLKREQEREQVLRRLQAERDILKRVSSAYNKETLTELIEAEGIPVDSLKVIDAELEGVMEYFTEQVDSRFDALDSKIDTVLIEVKRLQALSEANQFLPKSILVLSTMNESFWRRSNRIISFASGGAFLGGFIAQLPGAVLGVIAGTVLGLFIKVEKAD